jgi:hypothetical protein
VQEPPPARELLPLRGARLALALAWLVGVTALHLAVRELGLVLVP